MSQINSLTDLLKYIDPVCCDYTEWVQVGMALKEEGYPVSAWEDWSAGDSRRYHRGECERKWRSFSGTETPVTGGTIFQMAVDRGYEPPGEGHELGWDDEIRTDDLVVVDHNWIEARDVHEPVSWSPAGELSRYLETLFEAGENVGYVVRSWRNDKGKYIPQDKGNWDRTAGQLIKDLAQCGDDIGAVMGDYDQEGGAWIRFNPLDGKGVRNENVTDFRYALVESDNMEIDRQNALLRELELPIAVLMHSGRKSLHAIVRIDAADYGEYRKRVDYLYAVCEKNGMQIDKQNRNPSRLSRMPGVMRSGHKQFIIDTNVGKASWEEWHDWIEGVNDDLPDVEALDHVWDNLPELAPSLIEGVLRKGHKMLIAGPSKAGKTFLQIELCIAIAEGMSWLHWPCAQGRVMYVNLELDRASCLRRFKDVYDAKGITPEHLDNIDIWNLRGKSTPMDKLAPKLIRRAQKKDYVAIIIDPIYKVITGDENSADQMARFCNQFDLVCTQLKCAVIYCHHHSKGAQGGKKSMDRASGSGVFARDPDTMLDMIELPLSEKLLKQEENKAVCATCVSTMKECGVRYVDDLSQDDLLSARITLEYARNSLKDTQAGLLEKRVEEAKKRVQQRTAWRVDGTLREFPKFAPVNLWFDYPVHTPDESGALADIHLDEELPPYMRMIEAKKEQAKIQRRSTLNEIIVAFESVQEGGKASAIEIADQLGVSPGTVKKWFGGGKRARKEYKEIFKTCEDENDGRLYLERIS